MESNRDEPDWLVRARAAWPREKVSDGLDVSVSAFWIKCFLSYLRVRNDGRLPLEAPRYGIVDSYCRYLRRQPDVEGGAIALARSSVEWLLNACCKPLDESRPSEIPRRKAGIAFKGADLPPYESVAKFLRSSASWEDQVRAACRVNDLSLNTEKTYAQRTARFLAWWRSRFGCSCSGGFGGGSEGRRDCGV